MKLKKPNIGLSPFVSLMAWVSQILTLNMIIQSAYMRVYIGVIIGIMISSMIQGMLYILAKSDHMLIESHKDLYETMNQIIGLYGENESLSKEFIDAQSKCISLLQEEIELLRESHDININDE